MTSRARGRKGEDIACEYLLQSGMAIMERNYYSRFGEIDIIANDDKYIIFIEVKLRRKNSMVSGLESVTFLKQKRIIRTAKIYLSKNPTELQPRFDIIEIEMCVPSAEICDISYIKNAFWEDDYEVF